ncbi:unnamed protein product [Paramecium pentaurelia]|uniref:Transmembrane protein n=1 Tax=Paramecium pentaurelia TaxID=43138 RepID=A0A8S1WCP1_9CILI|nr:unnamed protein product [Paramecium pentaurelia]
MDSNEQDKEIQFLQKRVKLTQQENELLRKENQLQRQSLTQMKNTFTNIISTKRIKTADGRNNSVSERFQNEDALRQVLEMQRNRINQLEKDNEQYKLKYEKKFTNNLTKQIFFYQYELIVISCNLIFFTVKYFLEAVIQTYYQLRRTNQIKNFLIYIKYIQTCSSFIIEIKNSLKIENPSIYSHGIIISRYIKKNTLFLDYSNSKQKGLQNYYKHTQPNNTYFL